MQRRRKWAHRRHRYFHNCDAIHFAWSKPARHRQCANTNRTAQGNVAAHRHRPKTDLARNTKCRDNRFKRLERATRQNFGGQNAWSSVGQPAFIEPS